MGNSDSKQSKSSRQSIRSSVLSGSDDTRSKIQGQLTAEFDKNADPVLGTITSESFHNCLRSVQDKFDLYSIADSPLCIGLFYASVQSASVMNQSEYSLAISALLNTADSNVSELTTRSILKWYSHSRKMAESNSMTSEIMQAFLEASWRFGFVEMSRKLLSNKILNGTSESEAISRFSESNIRSLSAQSPYIDRGICVTVGDESLTVPTSFSHLNGSSRGAYPEL